MESEEYLYGKLLYEETDERAKQHYSGSNKIAAMMIVLGFWMLITSILVFFASIYYGMLFFVPAIVFIIMGIRIILLRKTFQKFRIYDKGIKFGHPKKPILEFGNIEHISIGVDKEYNTNYFAVKVKGEKYYNCKFADGPTRLLSIRFPEDYGKILAIIEKRIKEVNKGVDEKRLIIRK